MPQAKSYMDMDPTEMLCDDLIDERRAQDRKFGEQNHLPFVFITILAEELGEAAQAVLKALYEEPDKCEEWFANYRTELLQLAAVAVQAIEAFDRGKWRAQLDPAQRIAELEALIPAALLAAMSEFEAESTQWAAEAPHYVPGYMNALIDVARRLGYAYNKDGRMRRLT